MIQSKLAAQRPWRLAVWLFLAICLAAGIPSLAQSARGTLTGSVKDPNGAALPGAALNLHETNTGSAYAGASSSDGLFTFPELPPGTYTLEVNAAGFEAFRQVGIDVSVGGTSTVTAQLKVGSAQATVTVNGDASHLETESSDVGFTMSPQVLESLPLPFGGEIRNPLEFAALSPGFGGTMSNNPSSPPSGNFKLSGGQTGGEDILLDGSTTELASANMQVTYNFSVEAVSEFKVMTNTFDAQFGSASGGVVNLVSKQGTNIWHGSAYDLLKNRVLDANSWTNDYANAQDGKIVDTKPIDTQNDFGASVGGPVRVPWLYNGRDKTFFFFNYEGFRQENGGTSQLSAPTQAMLGGDFSSLLTPTTINGQTFPAHILYDYTTCTGANQGQPCQAYPNNKITEAADPVFAAAAKVMPSAPASATSPYLNIEDSSSNHEQADEWSIRMDQNIGTRNKITGSYFTGNMPYVSTQSLGSLYTGGNIQGNKYLRLGYDFIIRPTMLNHFNAGFTRRHRLETSGEGGFGGDWASKFGLKGVGESVFPRFDINYPVSGISEPSDGQSVFDDNVFQYDDAVSWQKGRHSFRFGGEFRAAQFNLGILTGSAGHFNFTPGPTSTSDTTNPNYANSGFGFASFYRGAFTSVSGDQSDIVIPQVNGFRAKYLAFFAADDWKVNSKLTLNLGLRYDMPIPVTEQANRMSYVDPTLPNPGAGGIPGAYVFEGSGTGRLGGSSPQSIFKKAFGPRVGLGYSVDPNTVIRAGYGIYFSTQRVGGFAEDDSQGFSSSYTYAVPSTPQTPVGVLSQITAYPGNLPPFIDPTVMNNQGNALFLESKVDRPGTIQNWTLDVQRQLPFQTIVDVAYVGAHGDHLQAFLHDPNQGNPADMSRGACLQVNIANQATSPACAGQALVAAPYAGFNGSVAQALRPFPQYGTVTVDSATMDDPFGDYTYDAMQAQVTKRTSAGLTVLASYSWSKNITNADSEYPTEAAWEGNDNSGALNTYNLKVEKALSQFDIPQRVVLAWTYDLPFGKGKKFASQGGAVNVLAGGWKIAAVQKYQSGTPLTVGMPGGSWTSGIFAGYEGATGEGIIRPNTVPGQSSNGLHGKFVYGQSVRFNAAAFTAPSNFTFGDAPKALNVRELFNKSEDFNVTKAIPMFTERVHTDFRVEFFDVFNRHQFSGFNNTVGTPGFGQASGVAYGPRSMQASLRVVF